MSQSVSLDIFGQASVPWDFSSVQKILDKIPVSYTHVGEFSFMSTSVSFGEHVMVSTDMDGEITTRSPSTLSFSILGGFDTPLWTSEYDKAITSKEVANLLHPFVAPFYSEYAILPSYSW